MSRTLKTLYISLAASSSVLQQGAAAAQTTLHTLILSGARNCVVPREDRTEQGEARGHSPDPLSPDPLSLDPLSLDPLSPRPTQSRPAEGPTQPGRPQRALQSGPPQFGPLSLDPQGHPPQEEHEFGGFMQAPSFCSWEDSPQWSDPDLSWDQSKSSPGQCSLWTGQNPQQTSRTVVARSAVEDRGSTRGERHSLVRCVSCCCLPLSSGLLASAPRDVPVPTLTRLLRDLHSPEEHFTDGRLLDTFHDLNKMIVQGYKQTSGVSQELLQRSLSVSRPDAGTHPGPGRRRVSSSNTPSQSGLSHAPSRSRPI
ncbi:hypothetical protein WMY93_028188 [Mugilogobius chulae]|uniref:Uncharacterized protein n=1 Tax=Mugilogobius chulae TaxID=88201 RepID=A0AAW0MRR8_9GOBI